MKFGDNNSNTSDAQPTVSKQASNQTKSLGDVVQVMIDDTFVLRIALSRYSQLYLQGGSTSDVASGYQCCSDLLLCIEGDRSARSSGTAVHGD